ncbi:hypothetical protein TNCV_711171 [Trichonephila clavipes]|nr:hypothetical protein TNCV_711171 [Trichonephila clavipes]
MLHNIVFQFRFELVSSVTSYSCLTCCLHFHYSADYLIFLQELLLKLLDPLPHCIRGHMWFQHDGAPPHYGRCVVKSAVYATHVCSEGDLVARTVCAAVDIQQNPHKVPLHITHVLRDLNKAIFGYRTSVKDVELSLAVQPNASSNDNSRTTVMVNFRDITGMESRPDFSLNQLAMRIICGTETTFICKEDTTALMTSSFCTPYTTLNGAADGQLSKGCSFHDG